MSRRYISIAEAAEYLKISDRTVRRLIAAAEAQAAAAKTLMRAGAVSPAKARLMRYPITPKGEAKPLSAKS